MLALLVTVLILAIAAGVVLSWSTGGRPSWLARGICLLLLIVCILAIFFE
jgi:membrane protein YdbS with pleckstrin-like domain